MVVIEYADFLDSATGLKEDGPRAKDYEKDGHEGKVLCCPCPGCSAQLSHVPSYERLGGSVPDAAAHYKLRSGERHGDECRYPNPDEPEPGEKAESASEFVRFLRGPADKYIYLNLGFEQSDIIQPADRRVEFRYAGNHMTARQTKDEVKLTVGSLRDLRRLMQIKPPGDSFYDDVRVIAKGYSIPFDEFALTSGRGLFNLARHGAVTAQAAIGLTEVTTESWKTHQRKDGTIRPVLACDPFVEWSRSGRPFKIMPVIVPTGNVTREHLGLSARFMICGRPAIDARKTQARAAAAHRGGENILPVFIQVKSPEHILDLTK